MRNNDRYNRGSYLLRDAVFVKGSIIPLALESKHWNIVVFESYRASELLIKSMVFLSGQTPKPYHALEPLIDQLCTIGEAKGGLPFNYLIFGRNGGFHGIIAKRENIALIKYSHDNFTEIGSTDLGFPTVENILALQLVIDEYSIKIKLNEEELLSSTDSVRLTFPCFHGHHVKLKHSVSQIPWVLYN